MVVAIAILSLLCVGPIALAMLFWTVAPLRHWAARRFAKSIERKVAEGQMQVFSFGSFPPPPHGAPFSQRGPFGASMDDSRPAPGVIDTTAEDVTDDQSIPVLPPDRER